MINGIRDRVRLRADGGIKTGFDVAAVMALGADEVSLGTALMISNTYERVQNTEPSAAWCR